MFLFVMLISSNVNDFPPSDTVALSSDNLKVGFGTYMRVPLLYCFFLMKENLFSMSWLQYYFIECIMLQLFFFCRGSQ